MTKKKIVKTVKRKKKITSRAKVRIFFMVIIFGAIISLLAYKCGHYLKQINEKQKEKEFLLEKIVLLQEEEEVLKTDLQKLDDPNYVARYAREKYLYSKDGEYIIRMP